MSPPKPLILQTGLCRICDSALSEDAITFHRMVEGQPVFIVRCPACQLAYAVDVHGDLWHPEVDDPTWTS